MHSGWHKGPEHGPSAFFFLWVLGDLVVGESPAFQKVACAHAEVKQKLEQLVILFPPKFGDTPL